MIGWFVLAAWFAAGILTARWSLRVWYRQFGDLNASVVIWAVMFSPFWPAQILSVLTTSPREMWTKNGHLKERRERNYTVIQRLSGIKEDKK